MTILGRSYLAHRVVWALATGEWPKGPIDHINGVRSDNRPENLRVVSITENNQNLRRRQKTKSIYPGVRKAAGCARWVAQIGRNKKQEYLGCFACLGAAIQERKKAEARLGYHPNHSKAPN